MAQYFKQTSDFHKRVENVMACIEENDLMIEFLAGGFRISDMRTDKQEYQNTTLVDEEGQPVLALPSAFEFRLKVYE